MIKAKHQFPGIRSSLAMMIAIFMYSATSYAQSPSITLDSCQSWARANYPLVKQFALIDQSSEFTLANADKGYLPRISINGQATYQSDVTGLPISLPNIDIPTISKDQYKIFGEINQPITDLFVIRDHKGMITSGTNIERQSLEIDLYKLKEKINELYFGILLIRAQLDQNTLMQKDLKLGIEKLEAALQNGIALQSDVDNLQAAMLSAQQQEAILESNQTAFVKMLSQFTNRDLSNETEFETPQDLTPGTELNRPELQLFDMRRQELSYQNKLLSTSLLPRFNFFMQVGYGRPALNFLSNSFDTYYIGGIRLSWNLSSFYTYKNQRSMLSIRSQAINLQEELFRFNNTVQLSNEYEEINGLKILLSKDKEIIRLRENIMATLKIQLENGTATSNDYLMAVNAADRARQNLALHQIQLIKAQHKYQITLGE